MRTPCAAEAMPSRCVRCFVRVILGHIEQTSTMTDRHFPLAVMRCSSTALPIVLPPSLALDRQVFNPFVVAFGQQEKPGAPATTGERPPTSAETKAAAAAAITPGKLRQEGEETEEPPSLPNSSGSLVGGGLAKALPANVGLMTLMQLGEGEGRRGDKEPWEAVSHAVRPASERGGRLTLLVSRKRHDHLLCFVERLLGELLPSPSPPFKPHEIHRDASRNTRLRVS